MSANSSHLSYRKKTKHDVCDAYLDKLRERGDVEVDAPGFVLGIRQHFDRLPTRYSLDVNIDSLDVLSHKRLLDEARADPTAVSFAVRPVEIIIPSSRLQHGRSSGSLESPSSPQVRTAHFVLAVFVVVGSQAI